MAQTTFEKTMRNVSLSNPSREKHKKFSRQSWQFEVEVPAADAQRMRQYMKCELAYYNALVSGLSSRMRTMPELLIDSNEGNEKLFLACAELSFDPYDLFLLRDINFAEGQEPVLPPQLETFRNIFFGKDSKGSRRFTDRIALLCQLFATTAPIHPLVRRGIASEIIHFYREQTRATLQSVPQHLQADQMYKSAPQTLEVFDSINKRHLQMPKKIVKVTWDAEQERSIIRIPYASTPLYIPMMNFETEIKGWNFLIIHQTPGGIPMQSTPWILDIRSIQNQYLLKYSDVRTHHSSTAFHQAKR